MNIEWNQQHGAIFTSLVEKLAEVDIRYFILRNYKGLPNVNSSKDVDFMIEPGNIKKVKEIFVQVLRSHKMEYYNETIFGRVHCMLGMNLTSKTSIHIDFIEGYLQKGYEIFTFDDLFERTQYYNNFRVLDDFFDGVMILIYKQFGYKHPRFNEDYKELVFETYQKNKNDFRELFRKLTGQDFTERLCSRIAENNFDGVIELAPELTKRLRKYTWRKQPLTTLKNTVAFTMQKFRRIIIDYKKYAKTFAVIAPDGAGKTTLLSCVLDQMNFYYVNLPEDNRFHVYHFRPMILPNLGEISEKAGLMKQNTDFSNPHRSKPANQLSSLFRIAYYTIDYIIGWQKCIRDDVKFDKYSVFDRYSYDFIVDPYRTKLNLPKGVRNFFVALTPQPNFVFVLNAEPSVIFARKQELTIEEIYRQNIEYRRVANCNPKRFILLDAAETPLQLAEQVVKILLDRYTRKILDLHSAKDGI